MDRDKAVPAELPALRAAMVQLRGSILTFLSTILVIRQPTKWHGKLIPGGRVRRWIVIARDRRVLVCVHCLSCGSAGSPNLACTSLSCDFNFDTTPRGICPSLMKSSCGAGCWAIHPTELLQFPSNLVPLFMISRMRKSHLSKTSALTP